MNVFIIETPHQLLNAIEAKHSLNISPSFIIIILLEGYPANAYQPLISANEWDRIEYVSSTTPAESVLARTIQDAPWERARGYYQTYELYRLRKRLDKIAKSIMNVDKLFIGNYWRQYMRHFGNVLDHRELYVLDDGTATLGLNDARKNQSAKEAQLNLKRVKMNAIDKLLGLRPVAARNLIYFTTYNLDLPPGDRAIANDYRYLRSASETTDRLDDVFFLGQTLMQEGPSHEAYIKYIRKVKSYFKGEKLFYIPHKLEPEARVRIIEQELALSIKRFGVPIEFQLTINKTMPKILASFYSSALENCRIIFKNSLKIKSFYIKFEDFAANPDLIASIYSYYEKMSGPYFEVVHL
jgi:hypothetical protein